MTIVVVIASSSYYLLVVSASCSCDYLVAAVNSDCNYLVETAWIAHSMLQESYGCQLQLASSG